jgi:hypothetical protein
MMKKFHGLWLVIMLALVALFSAAVMVLWNWLLPAIAGVPLISYWQAVGLLALARILFGGFGGARLFAGGLIGSRGRGHSNPLREKWGKMSEDERWEFIRKHHAQGGFFGGGFDRSGFDKSEDGTTEQQSGEGSPSAKGRNSE